MTLAESPSGTNITHALVQRHGLSTKPVPHCSARAISTSHPVTTASPDMCLFPEETGPMTRSSDSSASRHYITQRRPSRPRWVARVPGSSYQEMTESGHSDDDAEICLRRKGRAVCSLSIGNLSHTRCETKDPIAFLGRRSAYASSVEDFGLL